LARDAENSCLALDAAAGGPMDDLLGHSITYRVAVGAASATAGVAVLIRLIVDALAFSRANSRRCCER